MNRHKDLCWGTSLATRPKFGTDSRQQRFHRALLVRREAVKNQHGHGAYSWAEGMTRKAARRIARNQARRQA